LLTNFAGAGKPAAALSAGSVWVAAHAAPISFFATLASGPASSTWSRVAELSRPGTANVARIPTMASPTRISIIEKPAGKDGRGDGMENTDPWLSREYRRAPRTAAAR